jgi:hypothetical protein
MCILLQKPCKSLLGAHITNNNQAFYSQASWGRLEMKPHEKKKQVQNKSKKRRGKNQIKKGEKTIKC